ncbi:unnamed protein product (macronuclear) [Paramecium tetraurelia]|uniref:Uncharacterized protein n=1 Tax=Paramecium tetraurelia TaxID=5888 RepID=A0BWF9_PARTE|nr:uncharacterized protein GSPATT00032728001 [Paramecium tetraurelia]CAK62876.1 unnamed protein product [Paramecium tetraurelia]|eukprot:XP_001430274.1 hypothetical protein (macronuclear) [Paramecium tetraurelia strain d4-2]
MKCIEDVQVIISDCNTALESIRKSFYPFINIDFEYLSELELNKVNQIVIGFIQIEVFQENLLQKFKSSSEKLQKIANSLKIQMKNQQSSVNQQESQILSTIPIVQEQSKQKKQQLKFKLLKDNCIKQDKRCYAIAFNSDGQFVVLGCREIIKVFEHDKGKLNQIQLLIEHKSDISILNFMKKTNHFLSGSKDEIIIIWQQYQDKQWNCVQKLEAHRDWIFCIVINKDDNLIISCSADTTIKFWKKYNGFSCQQVITEHQSEVVSLSLNQKESKLISCSKNNQIFVIERTSFTTIWQVVQKIPLDQYGVRLCFINDEQFIFLPCLQENLQLYQFDLNHNEYRKILDYPVSCGSCDECNFFPIQYQNAKGLLVIKNGKSVNVMRSLEKGEFVIEQLIQFGSCDNYGQLSQDGNYLLTWDSSSRQIQIRKCMTKLF